MFNFGWWGEVLIILVVAILVVNPNDFPHVLRKIAKALASFRALRHDAEKTFHQWLESNRDDVNLPNIPPKYVDRTEDNR